MEVFEFIIWLSPEWAGSLVMLANSLAFYWRGKTGKRPHNDAWRLYVLAALFSGLIHAYLVFVPIEMVEFVQLIGMFRAGFVLFTLAVSFDNLLAYKCEVWEIQAWALRFLHKWWSRFSLWLLSPLGFGPS